MKLAISNIAWSQEKDEMMYSFLQENGIEGVEIAPTRIFPENPYLHLEEANKFAERIKNEYQLVIPSMQSILYGRSEKLFGDSSDRKNLITYTKEAIDFAEACGCNNLVFGSPKNRAIEEGANREECYKMAYEFFSELGEYAKEHHTVLAMEANPTIYNTNYINTTEQAFELVRAVDSEGFKINADFGTILQNQEELDELEKMVPYFNHVHISEPYLAIVEIKDIHKQFLNMLKKAGYNHFVSIEMGKQDNIKVVKNCILQLKEIVSIY